jgi:hypothetical protein
MHLLKSYNLFFYSEWYKESTFFLTVFFEFTKASVCRELQYAILEKFH